MRQSERTSAMFKKILIAINDSQPAAWAVDLGSALAGDHPAEIFLLHVVNRTHALNSDMETPSTELLDELRARAVDLLDRADDRIPSPVIRQKLIREGKPADEILAAADDLDVDLIVMGTHGRSRLAHLLLGSTAEAVVRQARCPVLAVPKKPATLGSSDGNGHGSARADGPKAVRA
jgi:universal stress protein A